MESALGKLQNKCHGVFSIDTNVEFGSTFFDIPVSISKGTLEDCWICIGKYTLRTCSKTMSHMMYFVQVKLWTAGVDTNGVSSVPMRHPVAI